MSRLNEFGFKKTRPLEKIHPAKDHVIHAKIKSVITDYKTGMTDFKKDQISQYILKQSRRYGYDPLFLTALIITESSFNHRAKSKAGALGLMQIRPRTGKAMATESNIRWRGTRTLYRPEKNIALGTYYLNKMLNRFGNIKTALEAYNHGPTRTARHLRRGKRTHKYSGKVFAIYNKIKLEKSCFIENFSARLIKRQSRKRKDIFFKSRERFSVWKRNRTP